MRALGGSPVVGAPLRENSRKPFCRKHEFARCQLHGFLPDGRSQSIGRPQTRSKPTNRSRDGLLDCVEAGRRTVFRDEVDMKDTAKRLIAGALLALPLCWLAPASADEPGVAERTGKAIDKAAVSTEKALKKAGEKTVEGIETAGKAVEHAGKVTGEAVANAVEKTGRAVTHAGEKIKPASPPSNDKK